jgi:chromosome segregation ATPase
MSAQNPPSQPESWAFRLLRFILRLFFVMVVGLVLGAALYFGALALYRNFVQAVQTNAENISTLDARQQQAEQQSKQRLDDLAARLGALETQGDTQKAALADQQSQLQAVETAQSTQTAAVATLSTLPADLDTFRSTLDTFQSDLATIQKSLDALQVNVKSLEDSTAGNEARLQSLEASWAGVETPLTALQRDLQRVKVMELIMRSRFSLAQNNLGLARQDIQSGREVVLAMQAGATADEQAQLAEIAAGLQTALNALPARPVVASDALDGAWNLLLQGLPDATQVENQPTATPTPTAAP